MSSGRSDGPAKRIFFKDSGEMERSRRRGWGLRIPFMGFLVIIFASIALFMTAVRFLIFIATVVGLLCLLSVSHRTKLLHVSGPKLVIGVGLPFRNSFTQTYRLLYMSAVLCLPSLLN